MSNEIWKEIEGYESLYEVSNMGRIRSLDKRWKTKGNRYAFKKGKLLKPDCHVDTGYLHIKLWKNAQFKWFQMHQLVAMAFIDNILNKPHVNHLNHQRKDNRASNLEWCTPKENLEYASKSGRLENINAKKVICIQTGEVYSSCKKAADSLGINYPTLRSYLNGGLPNKTTLKYIESCQ